MIRENAGKPFRRWLWTLLISFGLLRLATLGAYPLADTTEARYGNIARLMLETGDWVTPQYSHGVPFWGKPPLSTWLAAGSMKLFGMNEFAVRLPSFLLALAAMILVWHMAEQQRSRDHAMAAALILATSALFFVSSGAVMTDPALSAGTTLCMTAFWQALNTPGRAGRLWGYAFFIGVAVGLLAKGPVAVVLTALPIGLWTLLQRRWWDVWQRLPWLGGLTLTVCLSVPWYALAEHKTPGFLDYFLIGEHWKRFTVPGWKGDLYGNAHVRPKGTIWLYGLACSLPWSSALLVYLPKREFRSGLLKRLSIGDGWILYLTLWATAPMLFFTLAGNILWTYVLPGLPALALLTAEVMIAGSGLSGKPMAAFKALSWGASLFLLIFAVALGWIAMGNGPAERSQMRLIAAYHGTRGPDQEKGHLIYLFKRPFSAEFYSKGKALLARNFKEAEKLLDDKTIDYLAVQSKNLDRLPEVLTRRFNTVYKTEEYYLLMEKVASARAEIDLKNDGG
ncbi:ArnT family glycosyltransferase [Desulfatitalea tepidiphila]|uniref:ArnT family glycosyltransferase n=1 Tax=Desulfatitalea tepidiphila TaxID=1185843 RepID=UPI0006B57CEA|nr:glycosyltransferase family 39 protein [Desulfatitalea tepidiphila]